MSIKSRKFSKGIQTKPTTDAATLEGEQRTDSASNEQKIYLDGAERTVVTADQAQTVTNKSIDADNNTITNLKTDNLKAGVLITDISTASSNTELPSALAVKTALAGQNEASEITYDNVTSGLTATDVQAAVDEVEGRVDTVEGVASANASGLSNHLADAVDAHDASAISNVPSGNLAATDVQGALNELQTDVDTRALDADLTAHLGDAVDAHDASAISYVNTTSGLTATEVQAAIDEVEGRLDTVEGVASTNATGLSTHIADTSTHGVTGDIVGTSDAQVITAKDIDGGTASNTSRITIPKNTKTNLDGLTRKEATIVFGTDTKKAYVDDGTTLNEIGSGGGGLDVFYTEDYEVTTSSDFTTGNAAAPDAAGTGTINSTIANETVNQIAGTRSIKLTNDASGANDFIIIGSDIAVGEKQGNNDVGINFYFEYDGNDDDIRFFVLDQDDNELTSSVEFIKASATAKRFSTSVYVPSGTTGLRYGFQVITGNVGAVLLFDDIEFTMNPFVYKDLVEIDSQVRLHTGNGHGSTNTKIRRFSTVVDNFGTAITYTDSATEGASFTINKDGFYSISYNDSASSGAVELGLSLNSTQLTTNIDSINASDRLNHIINPSAVNPGNTSWAGVLTKGDVIRAHTRGTVDGGIQCTFTISAITTTEHVITPAKSSRVVVRGAGNGGESITANVTDIPFTEVEDTNGLWDGDSFTADSDGDYSIDGCVYFTSSITINLDVYVNGVLTERVGQAYGVSSASNFSGTITLEKDDVLTLRSSSTGTLNNSVNAYHWIHIQKIASEASLLAAIPTPKTCYIKDVKASGTAGGTFTSGAWQTRDLNTLEGDTGFVSLSSNQFTLSSGVYEIEVIAPAYNVDNHKAKLRNISNSTDDLIGSLSYTPSAAGHDVQNNSNIIGKLELQSSKTFEIQHYGNTTAASNGFGISFVGSSVDEVYTQVKIVRIS